MNDFRLRTAVLALALGGGVASTHAAEPPLGADVTRMFASHKPVTQWPAQAAVLGDVAPHRPPTGTLAPGLAEESRRQVASAAGLPPAGHGVASDTGLVFEPAPERAPEMASEVAPEMAAEPTPEFTAAPDPAPAPLAPVLQLALQPEDGRLSQAVRRYAERNGWQLAWEIERDFPIEYPATFEGDFLGIIEQIVLSLHNTDAPIRVKVYEANRVLRVVHATQ